MRVTETWPIHLQPLPDELLSSWLIRSASAHGQKVQIFTTLTLGSKAVWSRDIDLSFPDEQIDCLSSQSGLSNKKLISTRLGSFKNFAFRSFQPFGTTRNILSLGVFHRQHKLFGLQYCPMCLREDRIPYFRKSWRLVFVTACIKHSIFLRDSCPFCSSPIVPHRFDFQDRVVPEPLDFKKCNSCGGDLTVSNAPIASPHALNFIIRFEQSIYSQKVALSPTSSIKPYEYFEFTRELLKVLLLNRLNVANFRTLAWSTFTESKLLPKTTSRIEHMRLEERATGLEIIDKMLQDWPINYNETLKLSKISPSNLTRDLGYSINW